MTRRLTRRRFLKRVGCVGAALAAPEIVPAAVLGGAGRPAPSDRITLGHIGVGNMGGGHLGGFLGNSRTRSIAVCDVDQSRRLAAKKRVDDRYGDGACAEYNDFRDLLDR
ncbi:MAG: hypothetical protein ACRDHY_03830, partial [Anaerolineales bacterium]